ncbi:hypothetical protein B0H16DRAFT_1811966 [Mycena metata]|uniref:Uncharacterized protein n=1 Tax=Mycena metata TaxID=1033252 RepID=A0AAD7ME63_9AGAR|nr:hypothetical protein B0H16DRAFT_1811966 [Mycena metata]
MYQQHLATAQPPADRTAAGPALIRRLTRRDFSSFSTSLAALGPVNMPPKSNHNKARQGNLQKAREARRATVEEVEDEGEISHPPAAPSVSPHIEDNRQGHSHSGDDSDVNSWQFDLGDDFPDVDCDEVPLVAEDPDLDEEIVLAPEIMDEAELDAFSKFLFDAQAAAQKAERGREQGRNRPKQYTGNAPRTKRRHIKAGKDLAKKGFLGLHDFIEAKKTSKAAQLALETEDHTTVDHPSVSDHDQSDNDDNLSVPESPSGGEGEAANSDTAVQDKDLSAEMPDCMDPVNIAHVHLKELLEGIQDNTIHSDPSPDSATDRSLAQLNYKDFPALRRAAATLSVKSQDKKLDVFFRARITAMVGTLNLYLDSELSYSWREASMIVSKSQGHGVYRARSIRRWIHTFLAHKKLPLHRYGQYHSSILNDEDFSDAIKLHLQHLSAKDGHFTAQGLVDYVASPEIQQKLEDANIRKRSISVWTARRWLRRLDWRYGRRRNGMYIDGHEREDIVEYRTAFVKRWLEKYEPRMVEYDNDGKAVKEPIGYVLTGKYKGQPFRLILVTHDESTFYAHDRRKVGWISSADKGKPQPKGEGQSIMVSDFLTLEWGRLFDDDEYANRAARFISAYAQGLKGGDLIWINKTYNGHRILPPSMIAEIKASIPGY